MKRKRHQRLLKIITEQDIKTQEQLTDMLKSEGFAVTQATVSRDIKELGLVKAPSASGGYKYAFAAAPPPEDKEHLTIFSNAVISVECALHTVVIRTYSGMAQAVAASLDKLMGSEILGSIAGDDTILLIADSENSASQICIRLRKMFNRKDNKNA